MRRCGTHRTRPVTAAVIRPGTRVEVWGSTHARVVAFDKVNRVARLDFGTADGRKQLRDVHEDDFVVVDAPVPSETGLP